jgi:hypothetical protein
MKKLNMKQDKQIKSVNIITKLFALTIVICGFALGAFAAPPANDAFANAEVVSGMQIHVTRTNAEATKEAGETNHANNQGGKSVWFKWVAPMSRVMSFTTNRSATNLDTLIHVYSGTTLNNIFSVTLNNNIGSPNLRSFARTRVIQGATYYIAIDGNFANNQIAEGTFLLDIQPSFQFQGADFDSDGMTDFSYFRSIDGTWNVFNSSAQQISTLRWGTNGDIPLVYSNSGSGQNEYTVFRPSDGIWYQSSCCTTNYTHWGTAGDIPVPTNFSGDSNTQIAVFRPSSGAWFISGLSVNGTYYKFGQSGDVPLPGQYSPDGYADVAVFRPSNGTWYFVNRISNIQNTDTYRQVQFGQQGDKPVPADYDGDGVLDVAVFRPSNGVWYVLQSSDNQVKAFQWGIAEDIPTTGDYDGDGKFDYAVFRPSNGTWYAYRSGDNSMQAKQFGQIGDVPVTANRTFFN